MTQSKATVLPQLGWTHKHSVDDDNYRERLGKHTQSESPSV